MGLTHRAGRPMPDHSGVGIIQLRPRALRILFTWLYAKSWYVMFLQARECMDGVSQPPVIEVACGVVFRQLTRLKIPHYGRMWTDFLSDLPKCEHAIPIAEAVDPVTQLPLPRVWFIGESENDLVQLQSDRLIFNWRKIRAEDRYPGHDSVLRRFRNYLVPFGAFLKQHGVGDLEDLTCELRYINHVPHTDSATGVDRNLALRFNWITEASRGMEWQVTLPQDFGSLRVKAIKATRKSDSQPIFVVELVASGAPKDCTLLEAVFPWFDAAHSAIFETFQRLVPDSFEEII